MQKENRDTILDNSGFASSPDVKSHFKSKEQKQEYDSDSSFENEEEGIISLLEQFCKKGDLKSFAQFQSLIKGDN